MKIEEINSLDWSKSDGLLPAIVQDARSATVLMLGYMNREALRKTLAEQKVTFFSRSKQRLWTKGETDARSVSFLTKLEDVIAQRVRERPDGSYTARIWAEGPNRIAQKVGEEGVEVALAAVTQPDDRLIGESADLLFHLTLLLKSRNLSLRDAVAELERRHAQKK
jgi:phosphoribosyl-ATP pyrophosphohydrolase/phosphoribosyl-AMP cyclohydrolase